MLFAMMVLVMLFGIGVAFHLILFQFRLVGFYFLLGFSSSCLVVGAQGVIALVDVLLNFLLVLLDLGVVLLHFRGRLGKGRRGNSKSGQ